MKSSTHDSGEGSDPEESSQESMVTEIKMCVEEIQQTDGIAKNSKRWYKEFGFEEMDNDKTSVGKWTKCLAISWTLCLSMINTFYNEFRYKLPCPFRGHFRDVLYHFRSKVFENMRLRLICAQLAGQVAAQRPGKPKFELRPRRLIKLNEFIDLLDHCNVRFQASSPISSSFSKLNLKIIGAMKRVALHTARERWLMDDSQYTSFQVSGKLPKLPTTEEFAMEFQ